MHRALTTIVLIFLLAACSSSPPTSEEAAGPSVPVVEQSAASSSPIAVPSATADPKGVERYFELFATNDSDEQEKAIKLAAPKSPAAAYMIHQAADNGAQLDAGNSDEPDSLEPTDKGYDVCYDDDNGEQQCTHFTDIKTNSGLVSDFQVNGKAIAPRLSRGQGDEVKAGRLGSFELVSAYKTVSAEELRVTMVVRSGKRKVTLGNVYSARYRDPSGRQSTATDATAIDELDPNSSTRITVTFKKAKPGGVVTIDLVDSKTYDDESARVKI
jgi:hypothetical protein